VSSTALIGFGLDSVIEVSSAAAVAWQFAGRNPQAREKVALRIIAFSFFALAAYVTVDSIRALLGIGEAQHSPIGIGLAAASLVIMPVLSAAQRRAGRELGSASAVADSKQRWVHLERAHILSQPDPWLHTRNHLAMFFLAVQQRDRREAIGQVIRIIVAAPGSLSGRYPESNTGRARVGLRQPMPTPPELSALLHPEAA
jgi:hypothetical protein